jgi:hypothetical protein
MYLDGLERGQHCQRVRDVYQAIIVKDIFQNFVEQVMKETLRKATVSIGSSEYLFREYYKDLAFKPSGDNIVSYYHDLSTRGLLSPLQEKTKGADADVDDGLGARSVTYNVGMKGSDGSFIPFSTFYNQLDISRDRFEDHETLRRAEFIAHQLVKQRPPGAAAAAAGAGMSLPAPAADPNLAAGVGGGGAAINGQGDLLGEPMDSTAAAAAAAAAAARARAAAATSAGTGMSLPAPASDPNSAAGVRRGGAALHMDGQGDLLGAGPGPSSSTAAAAAAAAAARARAAAGTSAGAGMSLPAPASVPNSAAGGARSGAVPPMGGHGDISGAGAGPSSSTAAAGAAAAAAAAAAGTDLARRASATYPSADDILKDLQGMPPDMYGAALYQQSMLRNWPSAALARYGQETRAEGQGEKERQQRLLQEAMLMGAAMQQQQDVVAMQRILSKPVPGLPAPPPLPTTSPQRNRYRPGEAPAPPPPPPPAQNVPTTGAARDFDWPDRFDVEHVNHPKFKHYKWYALDAVPKISKEDIQQIKQKLLECKCNLFGDHILSLSQRYVAPCVIEYIVFDRYNERYGPIARAGCQTQQKNWSALKRLGNVVKAYAAQLLGGVTIETLKAASDFIQLQKDAGPMAHVAMTTFVQAANGEKTELQKVAEAAGIKDPDAEQQVAPQGGPGGRPQRNAKKSRTNDK